MDVAKRKRRRSFPAFTGRKVRKSSSLKGRKSLGGVCGEIVREEGEFSDLETEFNGGTEIGRGGDDVGSEGEGRMDEGQEEEDLDSDSVNIIAEDEEGVDVNVSEDGVTIIDSEEVRTPKRPKMPGLYKPPTHDELQMLKETQNLFQSNLMRLQITELLGEVKPKKKTASVRQLEDLLRALKEVLLAVPSSPQINLCEGLSVLPGKVKYPLHFTPLNSKGKFKFGPPSCIKVVGSYLLGTMTKPDLNVDLELHLPMECLQVKDILNYRYFHKRALYLSIIAGHLKKKKKTLSLKSIKFESFGGNPLLPILVLVPEGKPLSKYTIRLHTLVPDPAFFKLSKLGPDRNNVRRNFLSSSPIQSDDEFECDPPPPTPHYNTSLLMELGARERDLKELFSSCQDSPGFADAVVLYKVWARQRNLDKGYGGFTGYHFSMLGSALISQKKISRLMSCYQIFRVALQQISSGDWTKEGFTSSPLSDSSSLAAFHSAHQVVFLDPSGTLNLCADMSKERYQWLKHEVTLALELLEESTTTTCSFEALFMKPLRIEQKFDILYNVPLDSLSLSTTSLDKATKDQILLDSHAWPLPLLLSRLMPVLRRGLDKRIKLIAPVIKSQHMGSQWLLSKSPPDPNKGHVILGLLLDTAHCFSILTMGPTADSSEATDFRSFWGERSELRRFQDGSINEAVVWAGEDSTTGTSICLQIIKHLLHRHFSVSMDAATSSGNLLYPLLQDNSRKKNSSSGNAIQQIQDAFSELCRDLRRLKDLPLSITSLQATSPSFRHAEVFPSLPWNGRLSSKLQATPTTEDIQSGCYYPSCDHATPSLISVHPVVCQLESSGKWPDELEAIRKMKVAFYVFLTKALKEQKGLIASPTQNHLDILKSGHVFRLKIHHHRELTLLKEKQTSAVNSCDIRTLKEDAVAMQRDMVSLPVLSSTLNGLHQQCPAFGDGSRLSKRWVASHLLSNHFSDESIELMVAYLFTNPAPFTPPSTGLVCFIRFLSLLSTYDWDVEPLIVNFNDELSETKISDLKSEFSKNRPSFPPVTIGTPQDQLTSPWTTKSLPCGPVFHRSQQLAKEALQLVSGFVLRSNIDAQDVKQVFRTPLQDFNLLIHLNKKHIPHSHQAVDAMGTSSLKHKPNWSHKFTHLPVVDFDPIQLYLKELEASFSEFAVFFYDKYGGSFIAVVWKPHAFIPQSFKVGKANCRVPVGKSSDLSSRPPKSPGRKNQMVPDMDAIVSDFQIMGQGLVKHIEILTNS